MSPDRPAAVVVLAAGEGTRMKSAIPKVLHAVGGRTLVDHVVAAAGASSPSTWSSSSATAGTRSARTSPRSPPRRAAVVQEQQLGTGHAVQVALEALPRARRHGRGDLRRRAAADRRDARRACSTRTPSQGDAVTVLTADLADPTGYGRIVRDDDGRVVGIVEQKDATDEQRAVREINSGVYAFDAARCAPRLGPARHRQRAGRAVPHRRRRHRRRRRAPRRCASPSTTPGQVEGVNDRVQLAALHRELNRRTARALDARRRHRRRPGDDLGRRRRHARARRRPRAQHPAARRAPTVATGADGRARLHAHRHRGRRGRAGRRNATSYGAVIGPDATVGPYTYLRPGTRLGRGAKAGGFVEIKNADVGDGAKVPHLSYVGDADDRRGRQHRRRRRSSPTTTASPSSRTDGRRGTRSSAATRCSSRRWRSATAPTSRPARSIDRATSARARSPWPGAGSATSRAGWRGGARAPAPLQRRQQAERAARRAAADRAPRAATTGHEEGSDA